MLTDIVVVMESYDGGRAVDHGVNGQHREADPKMHTCAGLVKEQHRGVGHQLHPDGQPLALLGAQPVDACNAVVGMNGAASSAAGGADQQGRRAIQWVVTMILLDRGSGNERRCISCKWGQR